LSIVFAIQILSLGGLATAAFYLPRLLAGILIVLFGFLFVDFLASFVGRLLKSMLSKEKVEIADLLKNRLLIGLVAFVISLALDTMLLSGELIYPLIMGFVIIGAGVTLTDILIRSITNENKEFGRVAGYAKFILYSIYLIVGMSAIFAAYSGVTDTLGNIAFAFAIGLALLISPMVYIMSTKNL
jgi:hypothetical protein